MITKKELSESISGLRNDISVLQSQVREAQRHVLESKSLSVYYAIGRLGYVHHFPHNKLISLLLEAKSRGYFDDDKIFNTKGCETAWFKHHFSDCHESYRVFEGSLFIPAIGVGNNFSVGGHCIYSDGKWSTVKNASELNK